MLNHPLKLRKSQFFLIICILAFAESSFAIEYIIQLQSGYTLKITTQDQIDLMTAINTGQTINVSIISNNPEQEQLEPEAGFPLLTNLISEAIDLHHQYLQRQIVYSQSISFQPVQLVQVLPSQSLQPSMQSSYQNPVASNTIPQRKSCTRYVQTDTHGNKEYPCVFPNCQSTFTNYQYRAKHHKEHLNDQFLTSQNRQTRVSCPFCQQRVVATFAALMVHISMAHRQ